MKILKSITMILISVYVGFWMYWEIKDRKDSEAFMKSFFKRHPNLKDLRTS